MKSLGKELKALANRKRLEILKVLKKSNDISVGEIAENIGLSFRSTSRYLYILYNAELIEQERRGNFIEYRIPTPVPKILARISPLI